MDVADYAYLGCGLRTRESAKSTMNDRAERGHAAVSGPRRRTFRTLAVLGLLLLPIAAYGLGVYALASTGTVDPDEHFLRNQILLVVTGVAVSGIGAFLVWTAATAL